MTRDSVSLRSVAAKARRRARYVLQVVGEALEPGERTCVRCKAFDLPAGQAFLGGDTPFAQASRYLSPADMAGSAARSVGDAVDKAREASEGLTWAQFGQCRVSKELVPETATCASYAYDWRRGA